MIAIQPQNGRIQPDKRTTTKEQPESIRTARKSPITSAKDQPPKISADNRREDVCSAIASASLHQCESRNRQNRPYGSSADALLMAMENGRDESDEQTTGGLCGSSVSGERNRPDEHRNRIDQITREGEQMKHQTDHQRKIGGIFSVAVFCGSVFPMMKSETRSQESTKGNQRRNTR